MRPPASSPSWKRPLSSEKTNPINKAPKSQQDPSPSALTDIKVFADLIGFHGGWSSFSDCHTELTDFITQPQTDLEAVRRWRKSREETGLSLRRLVLMPRGHLKTSICTVLYVLWRIYRNPNIRILVCSNVQSLSFSFIRELRSYLEDTDLKERVWDKRPHIPGKLIPNINSRSRTRNFNDDTDAVDRKIIWNNTALQVNRQYVFKEPTVYAASVGSSVTGQHYDLIIPDDLHDKKNVESENKLRAVFDWIEDVESVINPAMWFDLPGLPDNGEIIGGEFIYAGTRYGLDDYYGFIIANQEEMGYSIHSRNIYVNGKDSSDGYIWGERYDDLTINRIRARMSATRFSSQYLNAVYEKEHGLLNINAIETVPDADVYTQSSFVYYRDSSGRSHQLNPIIAIDPAFSSSKKGDDCAVLVGSKMQDGRLLVFDGFVDRVEASTLVSKVHELADRWGVYRVFYEENGVGMLLPELFKTRTPIGRQIITTGHYEQRNKEAKIQGVLELPLNAGNFMMVKSLLDKDKIRKQIERFPSIRNDDFLDVLVTLYEKTVPIRQKKNLILPMSYTTSHLLQPDIPTYQNRDLIHEYIPSA